jgi:NAD+ diphosphatase
VLAAVVEDRDAVEADDDRWAELRLAGAALTPRDAGLLTEAVALANWHRAGRFSPRTGIETVVTRAGWVRHPPGFDEESSGEHVFPRTDAAVIVGVIDASERLLLARNTNWPENRVSVLAGFVEPGESFESAVEREVAEEVGVRVVRTTYLGSQPWPFPASVMVGFFAEAAADSGDPRVDGVEISEARWYSRDGLVTAIDGGLRLPGHTSIARAIIEEWYGGTLPGDW